MDPLEEQIRDLLSKIEYDGSNVLDQDVVHSLEIDDHKANVAVVVPQTKASYRRPVTTAIEESLLTIDGIDSVKIRVGDTHAEFEEAVAEENASSSAKPQEAQPQEAQPKKAQPPQGIPSAPERKSYLTNYDKVILVASGKGGVGKSTVAVNLALALKSLGKQVSLFDADIYGPSVPMMIGARDIKPDILGSRILPIQQYGIDFLSMGSLVDEDASLVWRGPMVHQAIEQMLRDTTWPGGDYLIMDMPPGTGDIQISLAQMTEVLGVVIVCTPQDVALLDAKRAIVMFEKVDIPILGMIENMSSFICPHCKEETPIFSKGGTEEASKSQDVPFIGKIPIELDIRIGGDEGKPVVHSKPDSDIAKIFIDIAKKVDQLSEEVE